MGQIKNGGGVTIPLYVHIFPISLIPIFVLLAVFFYLTGLENSIIYDPPALLPVLNLLFLFLCPIVVGYFAAKAYLASGSISLMMLGGGVFSLAMGSLIAGFLLPAKGPNAVITVHNVSAFIAGALHLAGATFTLIPLLSEQDTSKRKVISYSIFSGIFAFLVVLTVGVLQGILPVFFVQEQGATPFRQIILGSAALSFSVSGLLLWKRYRNSQTNFLFWYAGALFLISIGLGCVFIQNSFGSPIGWLGRIAQYIGGLYLLISVFSGVKELGVKVNRFDQVLEKFFRNQFEVLLSERTTKLALVNEQLRREMDSREYIEKELQKSEKQYRYLFEQANEGLIMTTLDGQIHKFNQVFAKMHGYTMDELKCLNIRDLDVLGERVLEDRADIIRRVQAGESVHFEVEHYHKDGHIFPLTATSSRIDIDGKQYHLSFNQDITERKQAEKSLRESEKQYRHLFDQANEGLVMMTLSRQIHKVNQAFAEMHGYSVDELKGMNIRDLDVLEGIRTDIVRRFQAGETVRLEVEHYHKDGHTFPLTLTTSMIDIEGERYYLDFHQDITERKQTEEQRDRLILDLQKALAKVKTLQGILPICSHCKKIRDDKGYWRQIESYIHEHADTDFSHSICPLCAKKYFPDMDIYGDEQAQ